MVTSASMVISERQFNYPFHFLISPISAYLSLGVILGVICLSFKLRAMADIGHLFFYCLLILLLF